VRRPPIPIDVSETHGCARTGCTIMVVVGYCRIDVVKQRGREVGVSSAVHGGSRGGGGAEQMRADVDSWCRQCGRIDHLLEPELAHWLSVVRGEPVGDGLWEAHVGRLLEEVSQDRRMDLENVA
jgi:hypothetical protein